MTLCCGCDMPIEIYADWCQDQGWDADELRVEDGVVCDREWHIYGGPFDAVHHCGIKVGYGFGYHAYYGDYYGESAFGDSDSSEMGNGNLRGNGQ